MEEAFAAVYRSLIERVEPDPARLRRNLQALARLTVGEDPPQEQSPLQFSQESDLPETESISDPLKYGKAGEEK